MAVSTRRELLLSLAAVPVAGQHEHQEVVSAYTLKVFSPEERKRVAKLVDLIIPRTDTPGASDAHVPEFIDRKLSLDAALKERFLAGLRGFDGVFSEQNAFSRLLKNLTIDGYYTSKEGLTEELGWHGNTFLTEFKGCTHADHE
jgi:hypothetical protein